MADPIKLVPERDLANEAFRERVEEILSSGCDLSDAVLVVPSIRRIVHAGDLVKAIGNLVIAHAEMISYYRGWRV